MARQSKSTRAQDGGASGATAADPAEAAAIAALCYEQALEELESLVQRVEDGELSLEDGIGAHRRAVLLLRHCEQILDKAQAQIEEISGRDLASSGEPD